MKTARAAGERLERELAAASDERDRFAERLAAHEAVEDSAATPPLPSTVFANRRVLLFTGQDSADARAALAQGFWDLGAAQVDCYWTDKARGPDVFPADAIIAVDVTFMSHSDWHENVTTVWNHIEAAIAYTLGHPLLVIVQHGTRSEGMIEKGYDWYVKWVNLTDATFADPEFAGLVADWKQSVERRSKAPADHRRSDQSGRVAEEGDLSKMTIASLLTRLRPAELWGILVALTALIAGVGALAYKLGGIVVAHNR